MAQPENLEARVAALETEVQDLNKRVRRTEQDAAAARVLAGGADRDVTEMREDIRDLRQANTSSFDAMREDMIDMRNEMRNGFAEMRGKFDASAAGHEHVVNLLNTIITQHGGQENDR